MAKTVRKINTTIDKDGFVSEQARVVVKFIQSGRSDEEISDFLNITTNDVNDVRELMDEHLRRAALAEPDDDNEPEEEPKEGKGYVVSNIQEIIDIGSLSKRNIIIPHSEKEDDITDESDPIMNILNETETKQNIVTDPKESVKEKIHGFVQHQIEETESKIKNIYEEIDSNNQSITTLKTESDGLRKKIDELNSQIKKYRNQLKKYKKQLHDNSAALEQRISASLELEESRKKFASELSDFQKLSGDSI